jgi:hypothetical protein
LSHQCYSGYCTVLGAHRKHTCIYIYIYTIWSNKRVPTIDRSHQPRGCDASMQLPAARLRSGHKMHIFFTKQI